MDSINSEEVIDQSLKSVDEKSKVIKLDSSNGNVPKSYVKVQWTGFKNKGYYAVLPKHNCSECLGTGLISISDPKSKDGSFCDIPCHCVKKIIRKYMSSLEVSVASKGTPNKTLDIKNLSIELDRLESLINKSQGEIGDLILSKEKDIKDIRSSIDNLYNDQAALVENIEAGFSVVDELRDRAHELLSMACSIDESLEVQHCLVDSINKEISELAIKCNDVEEDWNVKIKRKGGSRLRRYMKRYKELSDRLDKRLSI